MTHQIVIIISNGTLIGLPNHLIRRLQSVQNAAAQLIFRLRRSPTSRPDKDFGLPPRTICAFLPSNCLLLDVVLSLSLALVFFWNDLPADVTSAPSLFTFRKRLKLHLFPLSYPDLVL